MIFVARQKTKGEPADLLAVQCPWGQKQLGQEA